MKDLSRRLAVARGDEPADAVVRGGRVLSVFTREWLEGDVAICDGYVVGIGDYEARKTIDASGRWVVPGFVDAHLHLESPKLLPDEFARLVLPLGTTSVVADPHEIANVLGTDGVHWLLDACADLPLDVFFMASSCVPASEFESPRRPLSTGDLEGLMRRTRVIGLAEMMNFPGVVSGFESELAKLRLDGASHVDGHAPSLLGKALNAYASAGIRSDHEARTVDEGRERLRAGMWLLIREASGARNLRDLLPLAKEYGPTRIAFCTDDREPEHIADEGHINSMVRAAVAEGITPEDAVVMASLNPAVWHGLSEIGAIAPGYQADLLVLPDLESFVPELVLKRGEPIGEIPRPEVPEWVKHTVRIRAVASNHFAIPWDGGRARVIGVVPDQIVTESLVDEPSTAGRTGGCRSRARPGQDRRDRAAPRHRPDRPGVRARVRAQERGAGLHGRPRRAQHRRRGHERPRHGPRGGAAVGNGRRRGRHRGPRRARRAAASGGGPALDGAARRGARAQPRLCRGRAKTRV